MGKHSSFLELSHFLTENRSPLFLKMLRRSNERGGPAVARTGPLCMRAIRRQAVRIPSPARKIILTVRVSDRDSPAQPIAIECQVERDQFRKLPRTFQGRELAPDVVVHRAALRNDIEEIAFHSARPWKPEVVSFAYAGS